MAYIMSGKSMGGHTALDVISASKFGPPSARSHWRQMSKRTPLRERKRISISVRSILYRFGRTIARISQLRISTGMFPQTLRS
jgi:hypothetical protein